MRDARAPAAALVWDCRSSSTRSSATKAGSRSRASWAPAARLPVIFRRTARYRNRHAGAAARQRAGTTLRAMHMHPKERRADMTLKLVAMVVGGLLTGGARAAAQSALPAYQKASGVSGNFSSVG